MDLRKSLPLLLALAGFLVVATFSVFPLQSDDLFMYLAMGRRFLETGSLPSADPFLFEPRPWHMYHQWLTYLFFYGSYKLGGYSLISAAKTALLLFSFALPLALARRSLPRLCVWLLSAALACLASSFRFIERADLFTNLCLVAVLVIVLRELERPSRWLWLVPVIFLAWVNLHPGFPVGWAVLAAAVGAQWVRGRDARRLAAASAASAAACLANPLGWGGAAYPFAFSRTYAPFLRRFYFEWYSPFNPLLRANPQLPFLIAVALLTAAILWSSRRSRPWFHAAVFAGLAYLAAGQVRFIPAFCLVAVVLNVSLTPEVVGWLDRRAAVSLALAALALGAKNVALGYDTISGHRAFGFGIDRKVVPIDAVEWMRSNGIRGNAYNPHFFGAYLAWAWDGKFLYDGSVVDPDYFLNDYLPFARSNEDFDRLVRKHRIEVFLVDRFADAKPIVDILIRRPDWQLVYKDKGSLIFLPASYTRSHPLHDTLAHG